MCTVLLWLYCTWGSCLWCLSCLIFRVLGTVSFINKKFCLGKKRTACHCSYWCFSSNIWLLFQWRMAYFLDQLHSLEANSTHIKKHALKPSIEHSWSQFYANIFQPRIEPLFTHFGGISKSNQAQCPLRLDSTSWLSTLCLHRTSRVWMECCVPGSFDYYSYQKKRRKNWAQYTKTFEE